MRNVFVIKQHMFDIHDVFFTVDREWRFTYINYRSLDKALVQLDDLIGKVLWEEYPGLKGTDLEKAYYEAMETNKVQSLEIKAVLTDDWYNVIIQPAIEGLSVYWQKVTEKMQALEALQASEEKTAFQAHLLDSVHDAICALDENLKVTYWNDMAEQMFGWSAKEAIGQSSETLFKGSVPGTTREAVLQQMVRDGFYRGEVTYQRKDGSPVLTDLHSTIIKDSHGNIKEVVSSFRDVTERKQMEHALSESEGKYRSLFTSMNEAVNISEIIFDHEEKPIDFRILETNPAYDQYTGVSHMGKLGSELYPGHAENWLNHYAKVALTGVPIRLVDHVPTKDKWYDLFVIKVGGSDSWKIAGLGRDITERKRQEMNLQFLNDIKDYLAVFKSTDDMMPKVCEKVGCYLNASLVYCVDINEKTDESRVPYVWLNEGQPNLPEVVKLSSFVTKEYIQACQAGEAVVVSDSESNRLTDANANKSLNIRSFVSVPFHDMGEWKMLFVVADSGPREWRQDQIDLISDLSQHVFMRFDRVRAEIALIESKEKALALVEKLKQSDQNKDEFIRILSHELRNPLASITMGLSLLDHLPPEGEKAKQTRDTMKRQTDQLTRLVDDLLEVTRITQNKIVLKKELLELNELVRLAVEDYQVQLADKDIILEAELADMPLYLKADPARVTQIMGNLIHNAAKFTHPGGKATVSVAKDGVKGEAVIQVRDNGMGIQPQILPDLFQAFVQAENTLDRSHGGLGLGLPIVKGLVELHGGSVAVSSEGLGKGAEFTIRLPLAADVDSLGKKDIGPSIEFSRPLRILVIDDMLDVAKILGSLLRYLGHEVVAAFTGLEGVAKAKLFQPEVVFCDIGLPGLNGYEVAKIFNSDDSLKDIHMIALSGYVQRDDVERSLAAGFDRHLAKPIDLATLRQILAEVSLAK
ncbi:MAG: PAS domain-containing protein [Ignavibacteriales bacterium]